MGRHKFVYSKDGKYVIPIYKGDDCDSSSSSSSSCESHHEHKHKHKHKKHKKKKKDKCCKTKVVCCDGSSNGTTGTGGTGPTGPSGADSTVTGPTGVQGPVGPTGPQGFATNTGATGPTGADGATGPQGLGGTATNTGATGPTGPGDFTSLAESLYPAVHDASVSIWSVFGGSTLGGSGFLWNGGNGNIYVLTAAHLVVSFSDSNSPPVTGTAADNIYCTVINLDGSGDSLVRELEILGIDGAADVAVLGFIGPDPPTAGVHPTLTMDITEQPYGSTVVLLGEPLLEDQQSMSEGILRDPSFTNRALPTTHIVFDSPIYGGNSGGPVLNVNGDVIGLSNYSMTQDADNFGGGVNAAIVSQIANDVIADTDPSTNPRLALDANNIPRYQKGYMGFTNWFAIKVADHVTLFGANAFTQNVGHIVPGAIDATNANPADSNGNYGANTLVRFVDDINGTTVRMGHLDGQSAPGDATYSHVAGEDIFVGRVDAPTVGNNIIVDTFTLASYPVELDYPFSGAV
jgi:S1-C subfamily serine protease